MQEVISAAFDSPDAIDARFIPNLYVGVGEFFGVRVKCYMKDFVQNADAILNGDSDYFRGLHNIEIETYMKGADYESTYQKSHACLRARHLVLEVIQMSEILSNALDRRFNCLYKESIPLSDDDKAFIQKLDDEKVFKRDMREILIASVSAYRTIDDGLLVSYLKGAVFRFKHLQVLRALAYCMADEDNRFERYTREMRRCNQSICRIQRELARRAKARYAADPFPYATPY